MRSTHLRAQAAAAPESSQRAAGHRHRFLAALLLAAFSAIATIYVALSATFLKQCY